MAIASNFPAIKPSLSLDFANTKRLDSRVTFTRTTTATYYDGVTTAMAEQNLVLYSQEFDNVTGWNPIRTSISANTTTAPDGTSTADSLIEDSSASTNHYVQINTAAAGNFNGVVVNGSSITFSIFAKANTRTQVCLGFYDGSSSHTAFFDLSGGTVLSSSGVTASIVNVGSGWYRCVGVRTNTTTTMALSIQLSVAGSTTYTGNGTSGIYIWGAQLEQRSSVSSYTATTTQAITNYIPVLLTAASGVARFDHNPTTDESLGLLIEEARTNLLTYSADFSNVFWTKTRSSITSNTIVAPDGTLTGDKLVEDTTATNTHYIYAGNYVATSTTLTTSVFLKAAERPRALIEISNFLNGSASAIFNLTTGVVSGVVSTTADYTNVSASIQSVGNGWYRCALTATKGTANSSNYVVINLDNGTTRTYTGNGYSGFFLWGAQLEAGAFPTSYIATTAATVTRNADAASMTGSNFTSWFNAAEGTLYAEAAAGSFTTSPVYAMLHDGTSNNYIVLQNNTSGFGRSAGAVSGVSWTSAITANTASVNVSGRYASVYKVSDQAICLNNGTVATSTNGTLPVVNQLKIGDWRTTGNSINGRIRKIAYYPLRLTNAQLQALTS